MSILGSRDQLCIHPEVSKETNNATKLHMCHARTTTRSCFYHTNLDAKKEEPDFKIEVLDIEDLVVLGKKHSVCPYFMTKEIRKNADIIFMPYNYLLDPKVRKIHNIEIQVRFSIETNNNSAPLYYINVSISGQHYHLR